MSSLSRASAQYYSPREIARAAGVAESQVVAALGGASGYVSHENAVRIGRALRRSPNRATAHTAIFSIFSSGHQPMGTTGVSLALSSTLHAGIFAAAVFIAALGLGPAGATAALARPEPMRLIFLAAPGPGGGGGGGGALQKAPPPKAEREGRRAMSSPLPARQPPKPIEPAPPPPEPEPEPLRAEALPLVVAPLIAVAADSRSRIGALEETAAEDDSRGPGTAGGTGAGTGTGIGEGEGAGVGPGSGGGAGGGVYRPGSGIEPPRLLREVKPDYTEEARVRRLAGDVILEIVVRRDGSVGDLKIVKGLGGGLNERAVQAVRQWRFSPARRQGTPVDVAVEVAVEFRLR
jgi:TonB family protein